MNVLVIPEDYRKDQHILIPIIRAMFRQLGIPKADVEICQNPLLGGIGEALKLDRLAGIVRRFQMPDLFLLCVDRDGQPGRRTQLDRLERELSTQLRPGQGFLAENAWQEVEVWVLAGHELPSGWAWADVRREPNPKEVYFAELIRRRGFWKTPEQGRRILSQEAARRYNRIRQLCQEDVLRLETRIEAWWKERTRP